MMARLRATVAVALLAGIFVLAALVLGGLVVVIVWVVRTGSPGGAFLGAAFASVAFVLVVALVQVLRSTPTAPVGVAVSVMAEPALWAMAKQAADGVGTRQPDEIRLVLEANVGVSDDSRFLGLVAGHRVLYVGVPVLQTLTRAELAWVLGHEMGHYSERHPAFSGVTRRGVVALQQVVDGLGPRHPLGWLFRAYAALYARVVHAFWRSQELDADRWAASLTGPEQGVAALRAIAVTATTWSTFVHHYGSVGTSVGMMPRGLFTGYADFLSDPVRSAIDIDRLIADEPRSPFDTHPPTSCRIERLRAMPHDGRSGTQAQADEPALLVLTSPEEATAAVEEHVAREGSLTLVPWDQAVRLGNRRRDEERAVRIMSAADALTSGPADLSTALHLVATNRGRELASLLAGRVLDADAGSALVLDALAILVRTALVGAGHASHVLRWDQTDVIVDDAGVEVDVASLVAGVPGDQTQADWLLEALRAEGISRTWNPAVSSAVVAAGGPEVLAVLVTKLTWSYSYPVLYVTDAGLGIRRLGYRESMSIPPLSPQKTPAQLLAHSMRFDGLALLHDPDTEIVPWSEVEHVTYLDGARPRIVVRRGGQATSYRAIGVGGNALEALAAFNYGRMSLG